MGKTLSIKQIEIDEANPFKNCALGRQRYANILESIISTYNDGCVIGFNGAWGTGKTTFIRMWEQQLKNHGFNTIYYNAWESDFISDPMISLVGELNQLGHKNEGGFLKVLNNATKILSSMLPAIGRNIIKHYIGVEAADIVKDAVSKGISIVEKGLQEDIDNYKKNLSTIQNFKTVLSEFAKELSQERPLVFFVDELDRCNPHYAVKVLERIKHLFSVPHIVFVLSIDKVQLSNSICGYYGSDKINSSEYLRRFIDVEYNLPQPNYELFFEYLYKQLDFDSFFYKKDYSMDSHSKSELFKDTFKPLMIAKKLSLRQIEKILIQSRLVLSTYDSNSYFHPNVVIFMVYLRIIESEIYLKILKRNYTAQSLLGTLESIAPINSLSLSEDILDEYMGYTILDVVLAYNMIKGRQQEELLDTSDPNNLKPLIKTALLSSEQVKNTIVKSNRHNISPLSYIINHIELFYELQE